MNIFHWNIFLALIWTLAVGQFRLSNVVFGFIVGYAILWLGQSITGPSSYFLKVRQTVRFLGFFFYELILANVLVALDAIIPDRWFFLHPAVIRVPLDAKTDDEITLFANFLTMTPGTLSLDVSDDRKHLYVHALFVVRKGESLEALVEQKREEIKEGFERRLLKVLR